MGINCEINFNKPTNGAYTPGSTVSGTIKYAFDEETSIKKIIVSLKGSGVLQVRDKRGINEHRRHVYTNNEIYVDIDDIIQQDEKVLPNGVYEAKFSFVLPSKVPPSLYYFQLLPIYNIRCIVGYYVRIKFERPGFFTVNRHFRKDITVLSAIASPLPINPIVHGEQKHQIRLTSRTDDVVKVEGNVESCVISPGGKIELNYEVVNDSRVVVHGIEFVLMETYTFKPMGAIEVRVQENVVNTESKTSSIDVGETQNILIAMNVPAEKTTIENNFNMVSREYVVKMSIVLPMPHLNSTIEIPVRIGNYQNSGTSASDQDNSIASASRIYSPSAPPAENTYEEPPPSYWEVMGEHKKDDKKVEDFD